MINQQIQVLTRYPVAIDSPDHLSPFGAAHDNHTDENFIRDCQNHFSRKISFMDLGTAGGATPIMAFESGNLAIGLEGSNFQIKNKDAQFHEQWKKYYGNVLFNCDISQPFEVCQKFKPIQFDVICAWEVIEHINPGS